MLHELALDAQTYKYRQPFGKASCLLAGGRKIMARALESLNGNQEKWRRILKTLIMCAYKSRGPKLI